MVGITDCILLWITLLLRFANERIEMLLVQSNPIVIVDCIVIILLMCTATALLLLRQLQCYRGFNCNCRLKLIRYCPWIALCAMYRTILCSIVIVTEIEEYSNKRCWYSACTRGPISNPNDGANSPLNAVTDWASAQYSQQIVNAHVSLTQFFYC